eukprot:4512568-Alexandrium_andersonii.AAC.1
MDTIGIMYVRNAFVKKTSQDILLPHELFACIHDRHPDAFLENILGGSPGKVGQFWNSIPDHPAWVDHP